MKINDVEIASLSSLTARECDSGNYIELTFKNGAVLRVTPDNDGFHFYRTETEDPMVSILTHITREHQPDDGKVSCVIGKVAQIELLNY